MKKIKPGWCIALSVVVVALVILGIWLQAIIIQAAYNYIAVDSMAWSTSRMSLKIAVACSVVLSVLTGGGAKSSKS
jgi:uncharacterized membrane protein YqiK